MSCSCGSAEKACLYVTGQIETAAGSIRRVSTKMSIRDHLGSITVRLSIGRMNYTVPTGLFAVGNPSPESPVFVTANYKLSFDHLRRNLIGIDGWILVLDTKGINVWCAAGKGTFGTDELIRQVRKTRLSSVVTKKQLILPQLGAPGVAAHQVTRMTGFSVKYGPVRAADIPRYLSSGMTKDEKMKRVTFTIIERLILVPVELVMAKSLLAGAIVLGLVVGAAASRGIPPILSADMALYIGGFLCGAAAVPILLPWLPGRAFSIKGAAAGIILSVIVNVISPAHPVIMISRSLVAVSLSAFLGMMFTGASTYTSESGVRAEMKKAVPVIAAAAMIGVIGRIAGAVVWGV